MRSENWWRLEVQLGVRAREPAPGQCAMRNNGSAGMGKVGH